MPNKQVTRTIPNNIVNVMKSVFAQVLGDEYMADDGHLKALESGNIIEIGKDVLDMEQGLDSYAQALIYTIGKIEIDTWDYNPQVKQIMRDSWEYGNIYEVVQCSPQNLLDEDLYNLVDGKSYADVENTFYKPTINVKVFTSKRTLALAISFEEDRLKTSLTNSSELNTLISGIRNNIRQQIKMMWDGLAISLLGCAIATSSKTTGTAVHLLTDAKADGVIGNEVTVEQALNNDDFVVYCLRKIATIRGYMATPNTTYNNGSVPTSSGKTDLYLLNEFDKRTKFGVMRTSYHNDTLDIGDYDVINMWQGVVSEDGLKHHDFSTMSTVIINDADNKIGIGMAEYKVTNCIGLAVDHKAIAMLNEREIVTSNYVNCASFWTDFYKFEVMPILNPNYGIVAFLLD